MGKQYGKIELKYPDVGQSQSVFLEIDSVITVWKNSAIKVNLKFI